MQYLKPIENLENKISLYQKISIGLFLLLAVALIAIPESARKSNPILIRTEKGLVLSEVEPWKLSAARVDQFSRAYLSNRFVWSESDFDQKKLNLSRLTTPSVFTKLKDSLQTFESMSKNQKAKSYYVLEEFHFSNEERKIALQITRVLRIRNAALATPIRIEMTYSETSLSPDNPYGLLIETVNEQEVVTQ